MYKTIYVSAVIQAQEYLSHYRDKEKFIVFCRQCARYNNCWACPPYEFNTEEYLAGYNAVHILGVKITPAASLRERCHSLEQSKHTGRTILAEVRQQMDEKLLALENEYRDSRAFFAGTCFNCPENECTRIHHRSCIHPEKVRPPLEAFGFDIGKTTSELLGIELQWSHDNQLPEYFTLISGFFTNEEIGQIAW
ncbi:MAG: DUF2284 domain-containing protein [Puniceicoccales bacterium]|jgi:predicted metal-binding protein|nr:DUF2284 domain-containing protein [Puniceicoccales bacterium]